MAPSAGVARVPAPARAVTSERRDVDKVLARVADAVSSLRELRFRAPVPATRQSRAEFRQVVRRELARQLGPKKNAAMSRALARTGFLPRSLDLAATLEEAETSQVAAYYDPRAGRFHMVTTSAKLGGGGQGEGIVAHELTHALQHQYFDLIEYDGGEGNARHLSEDERAARRYVVEGEATFLMLAYQAASGSGSELHLGPLQVAGVRMSLTMLSAVDLVEMLSLLRTGSEARKLDRDTRASLQALAKLPSLVATSMVDPYLRGAFLVSEIWARGGWAEVAKLYTDPPQSTEQVLHPLEKLIDARDPPVHIRLAPGGLPPGFEPEPLMQETVGELYWRCYFKTWSDPTPELSAADWGGDLVMVWDRDGEPVAMTATRWDSPAAATRFESAYLGTLERRFGHKAVRRRSGARGGDGAAPVWSVHHTDGTMLVLARRGLDVDIIDGARPDEIETLRQTLQRAHRE